jgi:hypothetical protein
MACSGTALPLILLYFLWGTTLHFPYYLYELFLQRVKVKVASEIRFGNAAAHKPECKVALDAHWCASVLQINHLLLRRETINHSLNDAWGVVKTWSSLRAIRFFVFALDPSNSCLHSPSALSTLRSVMSSSFLTPFCIQIQTLLAPGRYPTATSLSWGAEFSFY